MQACTTTQRNREGMNMNNLNLSAIAAVITLTFSAGAMAAQGMAQDEYKAARKSIDADYKSARAGCAAKTAKPPVPFRPDWCCMRRMEVIPKWRIGC